MPKRDEARHLELASQARSIRIVALDLGRARGATALRAFGPHCCGPEPLPNLSLQHNGRFGGARRVPRCPGELCMCNG